MDTNGLEEEEEKEKEEDGDIILCVQNRGLNFYRKSKYYP